MADSFGMGFGVFGEDERCPERFHWLIVSHSGGVGGDFEERTGGSPEIEAVEIHPVYLRRDVEPTGFDIGAEGHFVVVVAGAKGDVVSSADAIEATVDKVVD